MVAIERGDAIIQEVSDLLIGECDAAALGDEHQAAREVRQISVRQAACAAGVHWRSLFSSERKILASIMLSSISFLFIRNTKTTGGLPSSDTNALTLALFVSSSYEFLYKSFTS